MSDQDLVEALRQGQNAAWQELVNRYIKLVYHVVRRTLSAYGRGAAEADVEDVTFDLFQSLVRDGYRALAAIGAPWDLKAWLAISARRRAIDFVRRRRVANVSLDESREDEDVTLGNVVAAKTVEEDALLDPARQRAVRESMVALSAKERLVVQLFYLKGRKYRDIAKVTGMNANSISPTLMRAVEKMQKFLAEKNVL